MAGTSPAMTNRWWRHELLAGEIRTVELVVGPASCKRRQGRGLDRGAQFHRATESPQHEEGRPRLHVYQILSRGGNAHPGPSLAPGALHRKSTRPNSSP